MTKLKSIEINKYLCPRCKQPQLRVEAGEDSNYKKVECKYCQWWVWLKDFHKLKLEKYDRSK